MRAQLVEEPHALAVAVADESGRESGRALLAVPVGVFVEGRIGLPDEAAADGVRIGEVGGAPVRGGQVVEVGELWQETVHVQSGRRLDGEEDSARASH